MLSTRNIITHQKEGDFILDTFKRTHSLLTTIFKLTCGKLVVMDDSKVDSDGYTESIRRHMVDTALSRTRAKGIEPRVSLMLLYEQYITGEIVREELQARMQNRIANLIAGLPQ